MRGRKRESFLLFCTLFLFATRERKSNCFLLQNNICSQERERERERVYLFVIGSLSPERSMESTLPSWPMSRFKLIEFERINNHPHHHYQVTQPARISLTLFLPTIIPIVHWSRQVIQATFCIGKELLYIVSRWSSNLCPYEVVHRSMSLMTSSLLLQLCPACLVHLNLIVFVMDGMWPYSCCFVGVASRTCSVLLAAFLCNCRQAFSPYVQ